MRPSPWTGPPVNPVDIIWPDAGSDVRSAGRRTDGPRLALRRFIVAHARPQDRACCCRAERERPIGRHRGRPGIRGTVAQFGHKGFRRCEHDIRRRLRRTVESQRREQHPVVAAFHRRPADVFHPNAGKPLVIEIECLGGPDREIDQTVFRIGPAIVEAHDDRTAVRQIGDANGRDGQPRALLRPGRCGSDVEVHAQVITRGVRSSHEEGHVTNVGAGHRQDDRDRCPWSRQVPAGTADPHSAIRVGGGGGARGGLRAIPGHRSGRCRPVAIEVHPDRHRSPCRGCRQCRNALLCSRSHLYRRGQSRAPDQGGAPLCGHPARDAQRDDAADPAARRSHGPAGDGASAHPPGGLESIPGPRGSGRPRLLRAPVPGHEGLPRVLEHGWGQFREYVTACARLLARAHGQSPLVHWVAGYLGGSVEFDEAVVHWSFAYARQVATDFAAFIG